MNKDIIDLTISAVKAIRQHADHVQRVLASAQSLLDEMAGPKLEVQQVALKLVKPATPPWEADDGKTLKELPVPPKRPKKAAKKGKRSYTKKATYWNNPTKKRRKKKK